MQSGFRILEHPADLGIEAYGTTLCEAFECAAAGMMSIILDLTTVESNEVRMVEVYADDAAQLLVRWLTEVLYLYDGSQFATKQCTVGPFTSTSLRAAIRGEAFLAEKHRTLLDVKAVTYHQIEIREDECGGYVKFFLDI